MYGDGDTRHQESTPERKKKKKKKPPALPNPFVCLTHAPIQADVDYREMPSSRILRRYLAGNFTVTGPSTVLEGSYKLETNSTPFTEFRSPNPQPGTGVHRYLSGLYIQPERFNSIGFEAAGMNRTRANWSVSLFSFHFYFFHCKTFFRKGKKKKMANLNDNFKLDEWRTQLGLGPAIGATTWMINATDEASLNASPRQASFSGSNTLAALAAAAIGAFALL